MKVFVSGGAGVIGRELVSRLYAQGHRIIVGDLQDRPKDWDGSIEYLHGDLNHLAFDLECDVFFHLAATFERLGETPHHWDENFRHNVGLSHHLLNVIKARRVVFASSYLIEPYPRNLTGAAKQYTECELEFLRRHKGQDSISARIYRSYGCGSRDIISRWVRAALKGEVLTVYNDETALDFVYAGDVAEALVRCADSASGVVPVGMGKSRKVRDVVDILQMHFPRVKIAWTGSQVALEHCDCPVGALEQVIHWKPTTTLEQGIKKIVEYEKKRCG